MNKHYVTPTAELLSFKYRDQVVAASGADGYSDEVTSPSKGEQIWGLLQDGYDIGDIRKILEIIFS